MSLEVSLSVTALIIFAAIFIQMKLAKNRRLLQAQEELMSAQSKILEEADALVSNQSISDEEFYERSKVISRKLEDVRNKKPQA